MADTALSRTMNNKAPTSLPAAQKVAMQLADKLKSIKAKAEKVQSHARDGGVAVLHVVEGTVACGAASLAEGYWGSEKLMLADKVDVRWVAAVLGVGWGLYDAFSGEEGGAGAHALAFGAGFANSAIASAAVEAGKTLREKRDKGTTTTSTGPKVSGDDAPAPRRMQLADPPVQFPQARGRAGLAQAA